MTDRGPCLPQNPNSGTPTAPQWSEGEYIWSEVRPIPCEGMRGHNNPPGMIETIEGVTKDLNDWLKDHPVIDDIEKAKEAKVLIDRTKLGLKDFDDERDARVRPLNEQVKAIRDEYREPEALVKRVLAVVQTRLGDFLRAEELRKIAEAEEAQRRLEEAERAAREAERIEQERLKDAEAGELDIDVSELTRQADSAFADFKLAQRQAAIAERETKVKVTGGFSRAIGLKTKETLIVVDIRKAIDTLGATDDINEAVIKAARAYRKLKGVLPPGVASDTEKGV